MRWLRLIQGIPSQFLSRAERVAGVLGGVSTAAVSFIMLLIMYGVLMRYLFNRPPVFVEELSSYLLVLIVFFAVAQTFRDGGHIRVELVVNRLPVPVRLWLREMGLLVGLAYGLILAWQVWKLVSSTHALSIKSFILRIPTYIPQSLILVGALALILTLLAALVRQTAQRRQGSKGP